MVPFKKTRSGTGKPAPAIPRNTAEPAPPGRWCCPQQGVPELHAVSEAGGLLRNDELGALRHTDDGQLLSVVAGRLAALVVGAAELELASRPGPLHVRQRVAHGG